MYTCSCCGCYLTKEEFPPVAGMCPECHKSRQMVLIMLYNDVERKLAYIISTRSGPAVAFLIRDLITIRDNLRKTMRTMGWQGQF